MQKARFPAGNWFWLTSPQGRHLDRYDMTLDDIIYNNAVKACTSMEHMTPGFWYIFISSKGARPFRGIKDDNGNVDMYQDDILQYTVDKETFTDLKCLGWSIELAD